MGGDPLGHGHHPSPDHQHPVVVPGDERLDLQHAAPRLGLRPREPGPDGVLVPEVEADAASVVAVQRLEDHREPDPPGRGHGLLLGADHLRTGDRESGGGQETVGEVLVPGDVDAEGRGPGGHRGPDPALVLPLPQLDQRLLVETHERDVATRGLVDQGLGRWAEGPALRQEDQLLQLGQDVEPFLRLDQVIDQPNGQAAGLQPDSLLPVSVDHVVAAGIPRAPGLAPVHVSPGLPLEADGHVLGYVAQPRPVLQPLQEPSRAAQRARVVPEVGEELQEGFVEALERVRGPVLQRAQVDQQPDARVVRPVVRAPEHLRLQKAQVRRRPGLVGGRLPFGPLPVLLRPGSAPGLGSAHSDASRSASSSARSSFRLRRSNRDPAGRAWTMAPDTIIGRCPLMWCASVVT
jgi:hypothetical protein